MTQTFDTVTGRAGASVLFAGDLGFGEHFAHHPRAPSLQGFLADDGHSASFVHLKRLIGSADVAVGNLEVPLAMHCDPSLRGHKNSLAWSDGAATVAALKDVGFTALSLANDHALDCGRAGLIETCRFLDEASIDRFGAGDTAQEAAAPVTHHLQAGGETRTLVTFGTFEYREPYDRRYRWYTNRGLSGVNPLSPKRLAQSIRDLRDTLTSPVFVVYVHWGGSYEPVNDAQRRAARELVAAGADIVVGHGSHVAQPMEMIDGRPVIFGLGNCVWNTPGRYSAENVPPFSQLATVTFPGQGEAFLRLFPIVTDNDITGYQNRPVTEAEFGDFRSAMGGMPVTGRHAGALFVEYPLPLLPAVAPPRSRVETILRSLRRAPADVRPGL